MVSGLAAVFMANRGELLRFVRARGAPDAEDVLQELWLKLPHATAEPIAEPLPYLYRMANNLVLDRRRSEQRRSSRERIWSDHASIGGEASETVSAERIAAAREQVRAVERVLEALGPTTERVLRGFRLDGRSQRHIADELGISLSAVEKHLQKAYRTLLEHRRRSDAE